MEITTHRLLFEPPVALSTLAEIAASPLFGRKRVLERSKGDFWLETRASFYRLIVSPGDCVTEIQSTNGLCDDIRDIAATLGPYFVFERGGSDPRDGKTDWDHLMQRYQLGPLKPAKPMETGIVSELRPLEEEILRAITLLDGGEPAWVAVDLFARAFDHSLRKTLRGMTRKQLLQVREDDEGLFVQRIDAAECWPG